MNAFASIAVADGVPLRDRPAAGTSAQLGLVRLWGRDLAVPAECVREVVPLPQDVQPAFTKADDLIGSIVVRGQVVPLVDISSRLGFAVGDAAPGVVVVLRHDGELIGLLAHSVLGLTRISSDDIQPFVFDVTDQVHVVASSFALDGRLIGLIDPSAILALPGVPRVREIAPPDRRDATAGQRKLLVLSVAGAELAVDATIVVATVPARHIRPSPDMGSQWVGVVDYLDLEIPVIDDIGLIGLSGHAADAHDTLVIILRLDDDRLLGMKADRVRRIITVREQDIRPLPDALAARLPLFEGSASDKDGGQSLLLHRDALTQSGDLCMIASLTCRRGGAKASAAGQQAGVSARNAQSYLVFRTGGQRRACLLSDISQIVPLNPDHSRMTCPGSPLRGLDSYQGRPLTLVEFGDGERLSDGGDGDGDGGGDRMVLVVETADTATGFVVDRLETVAHAVAQTAPAMAQKTADQNSLFIQTSIGGKGEAIRVCRLSTEISRLCSVRS